MAPKISIATATKGAIAYQDDQDRNEFHYYPQATEFRLGENLTEFNVIHWGIGEPFYTQVNQNYYESVGAIISGAATIDITPEQRKELLKQIRKDFEVSNPRLVPLSLSKVQVTPYYAEKALAIEGGDRKFPDNIQFGNTFHYLLGCPQNASFAFYAGTQNQSGSTPNSSFAISLVGEAEFVGDPWVVEVEANLSSVWKYVKEKYEASVSYGWFEIGSAEFQQIIVDMEKDKQIKLTFTEGSLDTSQFGRQIFELGKEVFNKLDTNNEFFKFEPNPKVEDLGIFKYSAFGFGWSCSVNASYFKMEITQNISFAETITYTGRIVRQIPASMSLMVNCNSETSKYFKDLGDIDEPCITQEKIDVFRARVKNDIERKEKLSAKLLEALSEGRITPEQYRETLRIIEGIDQVPSLVPSKGTVHFGALVGNNVLEKFLKNH